ncbi:acyl-CoA dehydrogenase [Cryobacterium glaciale]|uniref:Acyl-CoA dehydrogenase n=1 Tax=Cryobacterium glaciale TaxID=1259145 RepID=A0A4R8V773_9MICO|nr:acyl-CoA dehydrogenase family protein [Cryobacterium glaciale]TFB77306.1 acyl-CoA dehydrogenase [Cryobacterium glaciale]
MSTRSEELLARARVLAVTELAALGREAEATSIVSDAWWQRLADTGLLRLTLPTKWGGEGLSLAEYFPILEVCAPVHGAIRMIVHGANGTWRALDRFGTDQQKAKLMPGLATGSYLGFCISEPRTGSGEDIGTTAVRSENGWILNGAKQWATLASKAQLIYIPAKARSASGEDLGITTFMVDPNGPGITRKHMAHTMGCKGLDHDVMFFDDAVVPHDRILGEIGGGLDVALRGFLDPSRLSIAASCVGLAQGALDQALEFSTRRTTFQKPISSRQYIQGRLADMATDIAAARALVMHTATAFDRGDEIIQEAAMCKYFGLEMVGRVTDHSIRVHGGVGYTSAYPIEQMYRDARGMWFEEGTAEVQKSVISRQAISKWVPTLPAEFYGPNPGPDSDEYAVLAD